MSIKTKLSIIGAGLIIAGSLLAGDVKIERNLKGQMVKATMPDGTVYKNPCVVNRNDAGIEIAHDGGVAFWKFKDLPENVQEHFKYDPEKAEAYKKKMKKRKQAQAQKDAKKKASAKKTDKRIKHIQIKQTVKSLEIEIDKTEKRIKDIKVEMADLDATKNDRLDRITGLAGKSTASRSHHYGGVDGARSSNRAERTKYKVVKGLSKDMKEKQQDYDRLKKELAQLEQKLPSLKKRYERMKVKLGGDTGSSTKGNTAERLKELDELLQKNLVTKEEYEKKRAAILKGL